MTSESQSAQIPTSRAFWNAFPWIVLLLVCSLVSWRFWTPFFSLFMDVPSAQFASIGVATMGAYAVTIFAFAGNWPLAGIGNKWARGVAMILLAKVVAALFWILIACALKVNLKVWAFPIICNSWLILAATSFIGGDWHLPGIPPVRKMFLNLVISVGGTLILLRTIVVFPSYWFTFLQVIIITGGLGYAFRRVKQPTFSVLSWCLLLGLMCIGLAATSAIGHFTLESTPPSYWTWNLGNGSAEFGLFFALTCGLNFAIFATTQSWPFCRIKQPWGTTTALVCMLLWCYVMTLALTALFQRLTPGDTALWEAQIMAWHTVFWGFSWVYAFGIGQSPYLWAGQKTPGSWDDVD